MSDSPPSPRTISYRPEIDGLRAVSVLGVVLYHFQLGFPGGYVGVDVFFVISGYLITAIISRELNEGTFTLRNFWTRRIRRIFPAVSVVTISVLLAGLFLLDPGSLENLARSAVAQSLMISNVFFWRDAGYFTEAAELKPLLHTWSLSIEEQFYVFLPLMMLLLSRIFRRGLVPLLVVALVLSLALSCYGVFRSPGATFYLLPTRAWELLAGSVAALAFRDLTLSRGYANLLSGLGMLLILFPMFLYSSETRFPGFAAIPPVLGAALILVINAKGETLTGRILSARPLVFIGLISYSLYLWHWPILSFSRHVLIETAWPHTLFFLALTFVLATLSWKFVEAPFRSTKRLRKTSSAFAFATITTALLLLAGFSLVSTKGIPARFDQETMAIMEDVHWTGSEYKEEIGDPIGAVRFGEEKGSPPDFVVWGDSHAMVLGPAFRELSNELDLSGVAFITPACPPVTGLWMPRETSRDREAVLAHNSNRLDWIIANRAKNVILVGRWGAMCGSLERDPSPAAPASDPGNLVVADADLGELTPEESTKALSRQLNRMVSRLREHGVTIWILAQVPEVDHNHFAKAFEMKHRFPHLNSELPTTSGSRKSYEESRADSENVFRSLDQPHVHVVDPIDNFFTDSKSVKLFDKRAFYRDDNHLTRSGVEIYLRSAILKILSEVAEPSEIR